VNHEPEGLPALDLAAAYSELQNLLLDGPHVTGFLDQLATLSAALVPRTSCGVTIRRNHQVATVASSDEFAMRLDEVQYGRGQGPCLQAMHTRERVQVTDLATEDRWGDYRLHALAAGLRSSVSLPLIVDSTNLGALNLYSRTRDNFDQPDIQRAESFALQGATALTLLLRYAKQATIEDQLLQALGTRAIIDQALGIVMAQRQISSAAAFGILRETSQNGNRKLSVVAGEIIETTTGHPPQAPRPFIDRRLPRSAAAQFRTNGNNAGHYQWLLRPGRSITRPPQSTTDILD
jgi:GAF domain-containing protein